MEDYILNISPIDGRYRDLTEDVRNYFSEYHLVKNRIIVEIEWLKKLFTVKELGLEITSKDLEILDEIKDKLDLNEIARVKEIEQTTKHDVKAVEYYIDEKLKEYGIEKYSYLVHFACTSEDINNIAYGIMIKKLVQEVYIPNVTKLIDLLKEKASKYSKIPMLSHTHGQMQHQQL